MFIRRFFLGLMALLTALAILAPVQGMCAPATATTAALSPAQIQSLHEIDSKIGVVDELASRHLITAAEATTADGVYLGEAKAIVGHDVSRQDIQKIVSDASKTEGLGTFWNFVVVVAGILFLLAVVGLIAYYLRDLLAEIPAGVYELMAYVGAVALMACGYVWQPFHLGMVVVEPLWFSIPGALALAGCLFLTHKLHFAENGRSKSGTTGYMGPGLINFPTVMFTLCTIAWGGMALVYSHAYPASGIPHILAFATVVALQAALGFSVLTMPGCIAMGWKEERQVPKSVFSSLIILGAYIALKLSGMLTGDLALFETGAIFMGAFVYFLGLLVMSNKWYLRRGKRGESDRYVVMQMITITSGIAAWYIGSAFGIGALLGVGGTFFTIYLLEKYYELPWKGVGWAWSLLGAAVILYFIVGVASNHPEYFIWGIK